MNIHEQTTLLAHEYLELLAAQKTNEYYPGRSWYYRTNVAADDRWDFWNELIEEYGDKTALVVRRKVNMRLYGTRFSART